MGSNKPKLRFKGFDGEWQLKSTSETMNRVALPVDVVKEQSYRQIGIRSHGKGIFYKEGVFGKELGNKRVFWVVENCFILNIVFAWELAVAKTTQNEKGMVASHRFPMYSPIIGVADLDYLLLFFLTSKGKDLLALASPGGAGRNKTLGQKEFERLKFRLPVIKEQQKIASFLTAVDEKIRLLRKKKELLEQYKKGVMVKVFSREIRFKDEKGRSFPDWKEVRLGETGSFFAGGTPLTTKREFYDGEIPFIKSGEINSTITEQYLSNEGLEKSSAKKVDAGDLLYALYGATAGEVAISSITGAINQAVLCIRTNFNNTFLYNYLRHKKEIILSTYLQGGQGNLSGEIVKSLIVPQPSDKEQLQIANFLSVLDEKIGVVGKQIDLMITWKKGLLQQLFV